MEESLEVQKFYEWVGSNRAGLVEIYLAEDENNVYFKSSRFVPKELFDSQLREISESEYNSKNKAEKPTTITEVPSSIEEAEKFLSNDLPYTNDISPPTPKVEVEKSPIQLIIEKQKNLIHVEFTTTFKIKRPSTETIMFMQTMFDRDEVLDVVSEYIMSQINEDSIKKSIVKELSSLVRESESNE